MRDNQEKVPGVFAFLGANSKGAEPRIGRTQPLAPASSWTNALVTGGRAVASVVVDYPDSRKHASIASKSSVASR